MKDRYVCYECHKPASYYLAYKHDWTLVTHIAACKKHKKHLARTTKLMYPAQFIDREQYTYALLHKKLEGKLRNKCKCEHPSCDKYPNWLGEEIIVFRVHYSLRDAEMLLCNQHKKEYDANHWWEIDSEEYAIRHTEEVLSG